MLVGKRHTRTNVLHFSLFSGKIEGVMIKRLVPIPDGCTVEHIIFYGTVTDLQCQYTVFYDVCGTYSTVLTLRFILL